MEKKLKGVMMLNLGSIIISVILSFGFAYGASVKATVNTQEVVKGNPVQLRIKAIGEAAAFPNIRDIAGVMVTNSGTSRQSSMQITVNGMKNETSTVRKYIFVPEHNMTIPSYSVRIGGEEYKTDPIEINVVDSSAPKVKKNEKFSFELKSDKHSISVGESFVITVYLSISNSMQSVQVSDYVAPTSADFFIKEIVGQKEYEHDGYTVIEKRYIVTPKKEGKCSIKAAVAKLGQADWSRQDIFGRPGISWAEVASNGLALDVAPLKNDADLVGDFTLTVKIDKEEAKANKPINLIVHIEGQGNLEDFEFPKYEIDGVNVFSDEAKVESHVKQTSLESSYTKSFAFISAQDFTIPARKITVYNPKIKETEILEIPRYDIHIKGSKNLAVTPTAISTPDRNTTQPTKVFTKEVAVKSVAWWMLGLAFLLGALAMYLWQFLPKIWKQKTKNYKASEALKILYSHISEGSDVEEMVRKLYAKQNGDTSVKIDKKELKEMLDRFR